MNSLDKQHCAFVLYLLLSLKNDRLPVVTAFNVSFRTRRVKANVFEATDAFFAVVLFCSTSLPLAYIGRMYVLHREKKDLERE
jgi:hypothetical protein